VLLGGYYAGPPLARKLAKYFSVKASHELSTLAKTSDLSAGRGIRAHETIEAITEAYSGKPLPVDIQVEFHKNIAERDGMAKQLEYFKKLVDFTWKETARVIKWTSSVVDPAMTPILKRGGAAVGLLGGAAVGTALFVFDVLGPSPAHAPELPEDRQKKE